jgi:hypothetical protein
LDGLEQKEKTNVTLTPKRESCQTKEIYDLPDVVLSIHYEAMLSLFLAVSCILSLFLCVPLESNGASQADEA